MLALYLFALFGTVITMQSVTLSLNQTQSIIPTTVSIPVSLNGTNATTPVNITSSTTTAILGTPSSNETHNSKPSEPAIHCPTSFAEISNIGIAMIQGFFTNGQAWNACKSCKGSDGDHLSLADVNSADATALDAVIVGPVWVKSIDGVDPANINIALYPNFMISTPPNGTLLGALCEDGSKNRSTLATGHSSTTKSHKHHHMTTVVDATAIA